MILSHFITSFSHINPQPLYKTTIIYVWWVQQLWCVVSTVLLKQERKWRRLPQVKILQATDAPSLCTFLDGGGEEKLLRLHKGFQNFS